MIAAVRQVYCKPCACRGAAGYSNADGSVNYYAVQAGNFYDDMVVAVAKLQGLGQVLGSPVIAGDKIIFGATDGNVYALSAAIP